LIQKNTISLNAKDERFNNKLNTLISFLNNNSNYESTLLHELKVLDQRRNLDSHKVFPDIYKSFI